MAGAGAGSAAGRGRLRCWCGRRGPAAQALPATFDPTTGQGLPRKAAAYGLLAKVYLHMAGAEVAGSALAANRNTYLDSAAFAARQVVQDGTVRVGDPVERL